MHHTLVGPLGFPFGFTETGSFNLTVYDFQLTLGSHDEEVRLDDDADFRHGRSLTLSSIDGVGFLLKRFKDEAEFNHYMNKLRANETRCAFEPFLRTDDDYPGVFGEMDDDVYAERDGDGEVIDSAAESGIFLNMKPASRHAPHTATVYYDFHRGEEGLYFLLYQICFSTESSSQQQQQQQQHDLHSKFELDFHFSNLDALGNESFLSAGEMILPHMFFYFSLIYAICLYLWVSNIRLIGEGFPGHWNDNLAGSDHHHHHHHHHHHQQAVVYPIHHLMTVLLTLKFLALVFESIRYHFLRVTGHAYVWSGIYYTFAFMKGTFLFTVILLLGSGWSFVKPFLGEREKTMACAILGLQVINNIAIVVLTQKTEGEKAFAGWTAILHMVDILCCCAVLIPIVWQVNTLEKNLEQSGNHNDEDAETIDLQEDLRVPEDEFEEAPPAYGDSRLASKLRLFRSFYLLVVGYIYLTRIVVYLFATMLDYRHTWLRHFVIELVTLAFYVTVGMQFRPMSENPYLTIEQSPESMSNNGREVELPVKSNKMKD